MMTLPHTFRMMLGSAATAAAAAPCWLGPDLAGLPEACLPAAAAVGDSRLSESLAAAAADADPTDRDVSVRRLVRATRMTQAGWKLRPGMLLALNVRVLVQVREASEEKKKSRPRTKLKAKAESSGFYYYSQDLERSRSRLKMSIWLSAQNTTSWSPSRFSRSTCA